MFQAIKNWFTRDKVQHEQTLEMLKRFEDRLNQTEQEKIAVQEELKEVTEELNMRRSQAAEDEARRSGTEPWVEIKSADFNELKGIQIELDWNEAFVDYLRSEGIKAKTAEGVVQKWVMMLFADMVEKMEEREIDATYANPVNDFL